MVTTSSSVPSPALLASTVKVIALPTAPTSGRPAMLILSTSYTLQVKGDPSTGTPSGCPEMRTMCGPTSSGA